MKDKPEGRGSRGKSNNSFGDKAKQSNSPRGDFRRSDSPAPRGFKSEFKSSDRPAFRGNDKPRFDDKPSFRGNRDNDRPNDRPAFRGNDKPRFADKPAFRGNRDNDRPNDRPAFRGNDKPRFDDKPSFRGNRDNDRPNDKPAFRGSDKPRFDDKPAFRGNRDNDRPNDRPAFRGNDKPRFDDKPAFRGNRDNDRPNDRPAFRGNDKPRFDDKPAFRGNRDNDRPNDRPAFSGKERPRFDDKPSFRGNRDNDRPENERPSFRKNAGDFDERNSKPRFERENSNRNSEYRASDRPGKFEKEFKKPGSRERIVPERENPRKKTWETRQVGEKCMPNFEEERLMKHLPPKVKQKIESKRPSDNLIRLNRYIANAGLCSRREADDFIESGQITVNGHVITEMGYKVLKDDVVKYGRKLLNREKIVYLLLNKPKDFLTTTDDPEGRKTVMDLVKNACEERIYPIGRLDRGTTGLLLLTNDGELADKLAHPSNNIRKIYQVELDKPITSDDFEKIVAGLTLEDGFIKPDDLSIITPDSEVLGIEIHSGKNRIVRRIFESLGYEVMKLDRTTYAGLTKKDLPRGNWRFLTEKEVIRLKYLI